MEKKRLFFIVIPAGSLFLLSFLTGIVSGVGFFTVLLRAFLFGAIFGAGGLGINLLVGRFLPELLEGLEGTGNESSEDEDSETGTPASTVDIVVEDDEDGGEKLYSAGGGEDSSFVEEYTEEDSPSAAPEAGQGSPEDENSGASSSPSEEGDEESEIGELESVDEVVYEDEDKGNDSNRGGDEPEELESADDGSDAPLPDLDSFSDSFQSVADSQDEGTSRGGASMEIDIMGTQEDSATVAKAVRTIMKRDQEG
jgi:hypothetical protein